MSNPFLALQERLADLLRASPYFAGLAPEQILTESVADLEFKVANQLLQLGFGVVITTSKGSSQQSSYELLTSNEELNVSIISNPTLDATHNAIDAQWEAIQAIQGKSVSQIAPEASDAGDYFSVSGHERRMDAPETLHVREIHVNCVLRLK